MATKFVDIQETARDMIDNDHSRVSLHAEMRRMFQMDWSGEPKADWIKKVVSPDAYDAAIGVMRLMMSVEPQITVASTSSEIDPMRDVVRDDQTERGLRAILRKSDKPREVAWIYDAALSAVLFGEIVARVGNSQDIVAISKNKILTTQAKQIPFTVECLDPSTVFTESDVFGTSAVVVEQETTLGQVRMLWGAKASHLEGDDDEDVTIYDYWDREYRCVWTRDATKQIILEKHELPFIPIVRRVVQGTQLWDRDDGYTVFPLLYALYESGMWDAQNIALTMIYSVAYAMGSVPFLAVKKKTGGLPDPEIDWTKPGINVELRDGVELERIVMDAVPEEMLAVLNLVEGKIPEMLMPKVVFGQSPGATMAYAAINLLTQGGRLPLIPIQQRLGDTLAAVCEIILRWLIESKASVELWDEGVMAGVDYARLDPDRLYVSVEVSPDIPQDRMQIGTLVTQLVENGLISRKTGREWINVLDDTAEQEQIIYERFVDRLAEIYQEQGGQPLDLDQIQQAMAETMRPEEPTLSGQGPLFNPAAGGLPPVMATGIPETGAPAIPGQTNGGEGWQ